MTRKEYILEATKAIVGGFLANRWGRISEVSHEAIFNKAEEMANEAEKRGLLDSINKEPYGMGDPG